MNEHVPSTEHETPAGAFQFLVGRARDYVEACGGCVAEERLIAHVFGTTKSPDTWRPLFESVIQHAPDLRRRIDGMWAFADAATVGQLLLGDFVAIDVETTGLRASDHRIIEVGLVRFADGESIDSMTALCNPGRRLPAYIAKLTGIRDSDLEPAGPFELIAEQVTDFIGSSVLVGHNVDFDIRFLNAELKRAGGQRLINERIDTMALAMRLLPHVRRPSLEKVAKAVGIAPKRVHRALDDAELAARCALLLLKLARDNGITSLDELRRAGKVVTPRPRDHVGRARSVLDTSHLESIPRCPGVYLMRDASQRIIYVGKAKNLRDRVGSYYAQPLGYTRKMDGLIESIARIDVETTGTELEALILEAQLIRRYQPRYNSALRSHEQYPYIRVTMSSPWPKIGFAMRRKEDGDRYFGPYRNRSAAKRAVELLNELLPLRTCTRSFKTAKSYGSPCLRLDLHQCLGPCVGQANRGEYLAAIRTALQFLEGDDTVLVDRIHALLEIAAARQDFERAQQLRNAIHTLQSIAGAGRRLTRESSSRHKLLVLPSHDDLTVNVAIIASGRIWANCQAGRHESPASLAERLRMSYERLQLHGDPAIDHTTLDDTLIVSRWLEKNEGHPAIVFADDGQPWDWEATVRHALRLTYEDFASWSASTVEDDVLLDQRPGDAGDSPLQTVARNLPDLHAAAILGPPAGEEVSDSSW
jgi:DNA polymerase III epsilon subunit family exonuclease